MIRTRCRMISMNLNLECFQHPGNSGPCFANQNFESAIVSESRSRLRRKIEKLWSYVSRIAAAIDQSIVDLACVKEITFTARA
jgi:hypothetical protein